MTIVERQLTIPFTDFVHPFFNLILVIQPSALEKLIFLFELFLIVYQTNVLTWLKWFAVNGQFMVYLQIGFLCLLIMAVNRCPRHFARDELVHTGHLHHLLVELVVVDHPLHIQVILQAEELFVQETCVILDHLQHWVIEPEALRKLQLLQLRRYNDLVTLL